MTTQQPSQSLGEQKRLFWACFIALTATSFSFLIRIMIVRDPAFSDQFNLTETEVGEIFAAGMWPFGISIVLFSLFIDRIGYRTAIIFAFIGHSAFALLTISANSYGMLYFASVLSGLAAGAVEAAINPIVATIFNKEKTKWLNILHAGWPAGFVVAGLIAISMGDTLSWQAKVGLIFIPVLAYGAMMAKCVFPVTERVKSGVSHIEMLRQVGFFGALISIALIVMELGRTFGYDVNGDDRTMVWVVTLILSGSFGLYTRSVGHPLFLFLTVIMMPLAITELSVDNWITTLMEGPLKAAGASPLWVLLYTMTIMATLRFFAGSVLHRLSPLGLLAACSALAIAGLYLLSGATGLFFIFAAATVYATGKTFFWPTMLGVVSEQCPKGGAMTINLIAAVGMLAAGIIGHQLLGYSLDTETATRVKTEHPAIYSASVAEEKTSMFGAYTPLDKKKRETLEKEAATQVNDIENDIRRSLLKKWTIFPGSMLLCYLILILWFRSRGGYKPVTLE